jgi:beta-lactamase superfamily II metal-dependent hydrolase
MFNTRPALITCAFALATLFIPVLLAADKAAPPLPLQIHWIDSEGGGSTLLVTPAGESVLIDTGNPGGRDAARILHSAKEAGLERLDHVIITHFHIDHFGGLAELGEMIPIGTLYDKGLPGEVPDHGGNQARWALTSRPYRNAKVANRVTLAPGDSIPLNAHPGAAPLSLKVLAANQKLIPATADTALNPDDPALAPEKPEDKSDNANSLVLLLSLGDFRFFDGGDLTWNVEKRLVTPHHLPGVVDLFQVNHHGLDSSNHPLLLRSLNPTAAVMNNGPRKGTSATALASLRAAPALQALYQVHENVRPDEAANNTSDRTRIANLGDLGDACAAHPIHCRVMADGSAYTLSVPSQSHEQTFSTRPK